MGFRRNRAAVALGLALALLAGCGSDGPSFTINQLGLLGEPLGPTAAGVVDGGDELVLMGVGFQEGIRVFFGDVEAPQVQFLGETELRVTTPAMPEGAIAITLRNPDATEVTLPDLFQSGVVPLIAAVTTVDPEDLPGIEGGVAMEVGGAEFRDGAVVLLDGIAVETSFVDESTLRFTLPPRELEACVTVRVRNPSGLDGTRPNAFFQTQENSLAPHPTSIDDRQLHHLIQRAGFGAPAAELDSRFTNDVGNAVDALLNVSRDAQAVTVESDALAIYGEAPPPAGDLNSRTNQEWWIHLIRYNPNPLQERMAWFLHDHFATGQSSMGGFDTHADQAGRHADLLTQLDDALRVFAADMRRSSRNLWDDCSVLVISEFGRRNEENGSNGTDHGMGNCFFVTGGTTGRSAITGDLVDADLLERQPGYSYDFRELYSDLIENHIGAAAAPIFPEPYQTTGDISVTG